MSENCLFCKIACKEIKSNIVYEDNEIIAFRDVNPQAPTHILVIPVKHIARISDIRTEEEQKLVGKLVGIANQIAAKEGIDANGYRLVFNCNQDAGQTVFHIHLHLLGGRKFGWPPG
jgi:histidine triad (HIT) family protein